MEAKKSRSSNVPACQKILSYWYLELPFFLGSHLNSEQAPPALSCGCTLTVSAQQIAGGPKAFQTSTFWEEFINVIFLQYVGSVWHRWPNLDCGSPWVFVPPGHYLLNFAIDRAAFLVRSHQINGLNTEEGSRRRMGPLIPISAKRKVFFLVFSSIIKDLFLLNQNKIKDLFLLNSKFCKREERSKKILISWSKLGSRGSCVLEPPWSRIEDRVSTNHLKLLPDWCKYLVSDLFISIRDVLCSVCQTLIKRSNINNNLYKPQSCSVIISLLRSQLCAHHNGILVGIWLSIQQLKIKQ